MLGERVYGTNGSNAQSELELEIGGQLSEIDFGELESVLSEYEDAAMLFEGGFLQKVETLLRQGYGNTDHILQAVFSVLASDVLRLTPLFAVVVAVAVLGNVLQGINARPETGKLIYYACFCGILLAISVMLAGVIRGGTAAVIAMQRQMNAVFPILLTLIAALGGTASVAVYQPSVAILAQGVSSLMTYFILPLFTVACVLQIIASLNPDAKLSKLSELFASVAKWAIGIVFTVFSAFLSVQGIYAGVHDGVSFRTAKYAIGHYIPIVGGYLSDGLNMMLAGSMLIKNSVGVAAVLLLVLSISGPVLSIVGAKLVLQLAGAVLEPLQDGKYGKFCSALSKSMNLLLAVVLSVAFMYFISVVLMICSANYVVGS